MLARYKTYETDVLIIGAGGAGLRTAIELHDRKVPALLVGKCKKREAHTTAATGGINAALGTLDRQDSWQLHAADTIRDGGMINDGRAVALLCKNAPIAIQELLKWGTKFAKEKNGKISQRFFGAATFRRACFVGDKTGQAIQNTLVDQVLKRKIPFHDQVYIVSLLQNKGKVNGAVGINMKTGAFIVFHAKAVVLATGGHSRMFSRSSSHFWENNGDGIALATEQGAECMDMEMFQFHPTGMVWPQEAEGLLVTEAVRGEGGLLTNRLGKRFMEKYDPERMELSARDIVARAIYREILAGRGTERFGVYLDITHQPLSYILKRLPKMYAQLKKYNHVDISKQKMEVAPTAHYSMGGLVTEPSTGKTTVPNLYAVGEVTSGVHGGNRLGGNSLAEIIVFGRLTGQYIARSITSQKRIPIDEETVQSVCNRLEQLRAVKKGVNPIQVKKGIQSMMTRRVGVIRNERDMKHALRELGKFRKTSLQPGSEVTDEKFIAAMNVHNMLPTCEMIIRSALFRTESRAAHFRSDYPKTASKWQKNVLCEIRPSGIRIWTRPVQKAPSSVQRQLEVMFRQRHHTVFNPE